MTTHLLVYNSCMFLETHSPDRDRKHSSLKFILDSLKEKNTISGALKHATRKQLEVVLSCIISYHTVLSKVPRYLPARNKSFLRSCLVVSVEIIYTIIPLENAPSCGASHYSVQSFPSPTSEYCSGLRSMLAIQQIEKRRSVHEGWSRI